MRRYRASWSGLWTSAMLAILMAAAGITIPLLLHQKAWIEGAFACLGCWVIAWIFVGVALYLQPDIEHDQDAPAVNVEGVGLALDAVSNGVGCAAGEGCLSVLAGVAAAILLFIAFTLIFEFFLPGVVFLLFWPLQRGLSRIIERHPECADNAPSSVAWAFAWATLAVGPVAIAVCTALFLLKP